MTSYPFTDRAAEYQRLTAQGTILDPLTRRLLLAAGLAPGMRVLDIGSGAGNVARLAAEIVGRGGSVVGVDADPAAVELASTYSTSPGIEFRVADAQSLDGVGGGFDAVTGRLILVHLADPLGALRAAASRVRPGGLVCMHEADMGYQWASPQTPLWAQVRGWFLEALDRAGNDARLGPALYSLYLKAGLTEPHAILETFVAGGPGNPAWSWGNVVSAAVPLMEKLGVATRAEVDPATLPGRLVAEVVATGGCVIGPPMTGVWAVRPAVPDLP
jgi:ubiquinone/menaquinone biosynthesis C-methylase UbiE